MPAPSAGAQTKFLRGDATWQTISSYSGTVTQKHYSSDIVPNNTKTISGLTVGKPVFICLRGTGGSHGIGFCVTSGTDMNYTKASFGVSYPVFKDGAFWASVIPTATSISITFDGGSSAVADLRVYQ